MTILLVLILLNGFIFAAKAAAKHHPKRHGHSQRYLTAMRLNHGLRGSPMAHQGFALEASSWHSHTSPYAIAAIAATESSLGQAACAGNPYNAYGLASCGQSWSVPYFRSWRESFDFMGTFIHSHWRSARTVYDLYGYAACSSCWSSRTAWFMRSLFGVGPGVRYP